MPRQRYVRMAGGLEARGTRVANPQVYPDIALRPKGELIAPVLSFAIVAGNPLVMEFSEELDEDFVPATTDFAVVKNAGAAAITSVAVVGTTVKLTMTVAIVQGDTLTVAYTRPTANTRLRDLRGNEVASFTAQTVLNYTAGAADTTVPRFSFAIVNTTTIRMIYDEQLDTGSVPATTAFSIVVNGAAGVNPSAVAINGDTVSLTITAVISTDTVTVAYTAPGANMIQDLAGNDAASLGAQTCINVTNNPDTQAPRLSYAYVKDTTLTLLYDEQLDTASTPATTAYSIVVDGAAGVNPSAVLVVGSTVKLTMTTPSEIAVISVSYTAGANPVQDLAGNNAANLTAQTIQNLQGDKTVPTLGHLRVNKATLILPYGERLDSGSVPATTDFAVTVDGVSRSISTVSVAGSIVTLTLSSRVSIDEVILCSYTAGTNKIQDLAGNLAANFASESVLNTTTDTQYWLLGVSHLGIDTRLG